MDACNGVERYLKIKRTFIYFSCLFLGLLLCTSPGMYGSYPGCKYLKNYTPRDYGHVSQNWCILQDKRGVLYVANRAGILEYDGVSWKVIKVPNDSVYSLACAENGVIYAGGRDEIGFLEADQKGKLRYVSLINRIKEEHRNFYTVRSTQTTGDGIYFGAEKYLFRWFAGEMKVWRPEDSFHLAFKCRGKLFIRDIGVGLKQMVKDSLKMVPGGEVFADKRIYMMAPYEQGKILIGTRRWGFFIYDGDSAASFPTGADEYLRENQLSSGIRLTSGDFALSTLRGGMVIIDAQGNLKQVFDVSSGLDDQNVKYVYEDTLGSLWLALQEGVAKIEYVSPFSIFDKRTNLPGAVLSLAKQQNRLYAGTTSGLFVLERVGKFHPVPGIAGQCQSLLPVGDSLLAATTSEGIFEIKKSGILKASQSPAFLLYRSIKDPRRVWVGRKGLASLYLFPGSSRWQEEFTFKNIGQAIRTIVEDGQGNLWLGTLTMGVLKVDFKDDITDPVVTAYNTSHGLPHGEVHVFRAAGHVMFACPKHRVMRFDEAKETFVPDLTLGEAFADGSRGVFRIIEDEKENIWFHSASRNFHALRQPGQVYIIISQPFLRMPISQVNAIFPDGDITWFGSMDGLVRFDTTFKKNYEQDFPTLIRKVLVNEKKIFPGYIKEGAKSAGPDIPYKDRNIGFEFAAPFFEAENRTQYRFFLEGIEKEWSEWSRETRKDYRYLDSGNYTFRVQAQNVHGVLGSEAVFPFKVSPPWYWTWWAFLLYITMLSMVIFFVFKWQRSVKLEWEKQKLEQVVKERTKEIKEKNLQLQEQSEQLKEMDKVKSRFFANISHEFRTPLTLIMGPLEQILANYRDKELRRRARLMLRNSQRLLGLVNQLLDLSKIESGKMKLRASEQNIVPFLKGILASFHSLADEHELDLEFQAEAEDTSLFFDPEKLEKVICNLLSNAIKFTPAGGKISLSVSKPAANEGNPTTEFLELSVADTGVGIPQQQLDRIFDRFYQAESIHIQEHNLKGSGIGLALSKELVTLHHGVIDVRSREGRGTEFIIRLPSGNKHLQPDEIVDPAETEVEAREYFEIAPFHLSEEDEEEEEKETPVPGVEDDETCREEKNIILVTEDSADARSYIRGSLEPLYTVVEAADGREGIEKAKEIIPDLVISDIMMPGVDGNELCRVLKKDVATSHIPIILLTAKASEESVIQGLEAGADDYITKPFNTRILCARIKNLIDLRRQLQLEMKREMTLQPARVSLSAVDKEFVKELKGVIKDNLEDSDFNVEELGKKLYLSRATLYRKILALSGEGPAEFIRSCRLKKAAQLLKSGTGSVTEVAFEVGFASRTYFTKCFKEKFHRLPSEFLTAES